MQEQKQEPFDAVKLAQEKAARFWRVNSTKAIRSLTVKPYLHLKTYKNGMQLLVDYNPRMGTDNYYLQRSDKTTIFILKIPKL